MTVSFYEERITPPAWKFYFGAVALVMFVAQAYAPISILADAIFDDGLYVSLARRFAFGSWFGTYNLFTIHKGNGYSIFLAAVAWLGIPVTVAHALFHILGCFTFAWVAGRIAGSVRLTAALFTALALVPVLGSAHMLRVFRDAIYSDQTLLLLAAVMWLLRRAHAQGGARRGFLAGLLLGWFWLTREEGIWIVPAMVILFVLLPLSASNIAASLRARGLGALLAAIWVFSGFIVFEGTYRLINKAVYGTWASVGMKEAAFERALGVLYSVEDGRKVPYVPVSAETRRLIYEVSPAFAALRQEIDRDGGTTWTYGCAFYPESCGDIAGGWFHVALLQAVEAIGAHTTPAQASAYYNRIAQEVGAACADGRLHCSPTLHSIIPRLAPDFTATLGARVYRILEPALLIIPFHLWAIPSQGTEDQIADAKAILNRPLHVPSVAMPQRVKIETQYDGPAPEAFSIRMVDDKGQPLEAGVEEITMPPPVGKERRLLVSLSCATPACILEALHGDSVMVRVRLWDLVAQSSRFPTPGGSFKILRMRVDGESILGDVRLRASLLIRSAEMRAAPLVLPALTALGVVAWIAGCALCLLGRTLPPTLVMATALGGSLLLRLTIFTIGDGAGLPVNPAYLAPITFLSTAAAVLALHGAATAGAAWRARSITR